MALSGVDLFSGAGGLSLGARRSGIDVLVAVEQNNDAAQTYRLNHPDTLVINSDIREVHTRDFFIQSPFIVFGGPPCQGFSISNMKTRNLKNPSNFLFEEFIRVIKDLSPEWFLFENVEGLLQFDGGSVYNAIIQQLEGLGYSVISRVLLASNYGVPQKRSRLFIVGNKDGQSFIFPDIKEHQVTVWDAIGDLPDLENGAMYEELPYKEEYASASPYAKEMREGSTMSTQNYVTRNAEYIIDRYKYISQGQNWSAIPDHLMTSYTNRSNCHSGLFRRLHENQPSVIISNYRKSMLIHPREDRGLSVREAARLQSFPDSYRFAGKLMSIQQQIGNAVPPLLSEVIFKAIVKQSQI